MKRTILIDPRAGSKELVKPLENLGLPVESAMLDYGDLMFLGRGEGGVNVSIGIEHKKLADFVQSMDSRLPGHQLPGLVSHYDRAWLIIEGEWQHDPTGRVTRWAGGRGGRQVVRGAPQAIEMEKKILTLEIRGGIHIRLCPTRRDTLRFISALYRWWTDSDLDEHRSHLALHAPDLDGTLFRPVSWLRMHLAQVPGIGQEWSKVLEDYCNGNPQEWAAMVLRKNVTEWAELTARTKTGKLRRLGPARAASIVEALSHAR